MAHVGPPLWFTVLIIGWRLDLMIYARLIQLLEKPLVEIFPVEISMVRRHGFDTNDSEAPRIQLKLFQHVCCDSLFRPQSQCRLAYSRRTADEDERPRNSIIDGTCQTIASFFQLRMPDGVGLEIAGSLGV